MRTTFKRMEFLSLGLSVMFVLVFWNNIQITRVLRSEVDVNQNHHPSSKDLKNTTSPRRLGDGCHHVFLDVGANIGIHTRFLFEPELYPHTYSSALLFNQTFGTHRDNRDFCAFGFEPNPVHVARHQNLSRAYHERGWRYTFVHAGASDQTGNFTFYHKGDDAKEEWGFSMVNQSYPKRPSTKVTVPQVNLAEWIEYHIYERKKPTTVYGTQYPSGTKATVMMKLDIEGSEYFVLPSLLYTGVFCKALDVVFGETHERLNKGEYVTKISRRGSGEHKKGQVYFRDEEDARLWYHYLMERGLKTLLPSTCQTVYLDQDDESYLHDGQPLPTALKNTTSK
mmetsp:Transcript_19866/g.29853  ORF Transcript_19866/g.29853 Transcript_19866/m.29853 type:complete len:338 (-) Transcript_19866:699-1712(-)|eukprot:CAMPEP_0178898240 /NCGR_PEP_ID=MMETSP0786-20121207/2218_1 /TAXON_ID=186022 /ORGANISM="Thalassionema frauenfeldii, Strain CCMP 1798" /LENGTH=337 /DNA_ID=CAMNT_0020568931 /DNA_START=451 /DNA_END=1464 /DNA_ORIENTATION=-